MSTTTATKPDAKAAGKDAADKGTKPGGKKKKKLIIIAAGLLVLAGFGGYLMLGKSSSAPAAPKPGKVLALDAITVNLTDGHYLKIKLALQETSTAGSLDGSQALDLTISEFSNRSIAELSSNTARDTVKADLAKKIAKAYDDQVMGLYLTEFVMQ